MTLRELLAALQAIDPKSLDMEAMVSPLSGGYASIDRVEVLYAGHPVIHLAEPKGEEPPDLWKGSANQEVDKVDPADLRAVWNLMEDMDKQGTQAISLEIYERVCRPGADVQSVWYRVSMIAMLCKVLPGFDPTDTMFKVAANFPMKKMPVGVPQQGPPFDLKEFIAQVARRS
jgi:hypothetical protein